MVGGFSPWDDSQTNVSWVDKKVSLCPANFYYSVDKVTAGNHNYAYALYFPGNESAARGKVIFAPTYHDVTRQVYQTAVGRWQRYARALEPLHGVLEPFCRAFGYGG